ncbi:12429_t:CDS:1, partial [Entrophospora sp. SA101]
MDDNNDDDLFSLLITKEEYKTYLSNTKDSPFPPYEVFEKIISVNDPEKMLRIIRDNIDDVNIQKRWAQTFIYAR